MGGRLAELIKQARSLEGAARSELVQRVRAEDPELAQSLLAGLGDSEDGPPSKADPGISLEVVSEGTSGAARVVQRLAGREESYERYKLEGEVARGGQGAIHRVWDEDLRRVLAMKVVLAKGEHRRDDPTTPVDSKTLGRFLEEAQVTGQLDHPGIVPVHELGLDAHGQVYFTMKLVKGRDLKAVFELVRQGREGWTLTRALNVLLKACEAMAYAHSKGVIHRDLKPGNVMVGRYGEVYVMDWGLARVLDREDTKDVRIQPPTMTTEVLADRPDGVAPDSDSPIVTMDGDIVGTPAYMPPEQAAGDLGAMGPHSDVYALGAMLYHLLTGQMPYVPRGARLSGYAVWALLQARPPEPVEKLAPGLPAELVAICEKAMARDPSRRYPDMNALGEDLRAFLENRVVSAYRTGAYVELKKWVQRNRALASALAAGVLALAGGLAYSRVQEARAEASERLAEERRDEVLQLAALQQLDDRVAEADELWPARPENIQRYVDWLEDARELTARLPAHRSKLAELRSRALPRTEAERQEQRRDHPLFPELEHREAEIATLRAAYLHRRDGLEPELPEVDWSALPPSTPGLNEFAWRRVDPEREGSGEEALALAVARRAAAEAPRNARIQSTLAWASFALGFDDEALDASHAALELAGPRLKEEFGDELERLEEAVARATSDAGLARAATELERLDARRIDLDARVDERRDWRFPDDEPEARWWNNQLTKLIAGLESLEAELLSEEPDAVTPVHGWSIPRRLAFARELERSYGEGGDRTRAWMQALPALRAAYPGLDPTPQFGLAPLGPDPDSGLWEFAHLATGAVPERGPSGGLEPSEETGLVLVLIPGGTFAMGAQSHDPSGDNYDPAANPDERPLHEVALSPFFLSKYEMTQAQWLRFTGSNPSYYGPHNYGSGYNAAGLPGSSMQPVEKVSWDDCMRVLARMRLTLPSEAQWEYAARAGTTSAWWTGSNAADLAWAGNVGDAWARSNGGPPSWFYESWDDGHTVHAPVGSYAPNRFGLHDVVGNVAEWCLDPYDARAYRASAARNPVAEETSSGFRVIRGGGYLLGSAQARSAARTGNSPNAVDTGLGVRPARALEP